MRPMQGDPKVIQFLNDALSHELTAINQYFLHSRMLGNWGISKLAQKEYDESIDEMRHADTLIERILFLEGLPNLQRLNKLKIGEDVSEILECDLALEHEALTLYRDAVEYCEGVRDYASRDLFSHILRSEEEHVDYLETQIEMISRIGIERFIQLQTKPNEIYSGSD